MMNILSQLKGHKVVEVNKSTGLRIGHMEAQAKFDKKGYDKDFLDNGHILALNANGDLQMAGAEETTYFLHYSEEHIKILNSASLYMFTVDLTNDAYPRAIALCEGDVVTTDNFLGKVTEEAHQVKVVNGVLTLGEKVADDYKGPIAKAGVLPSGKSAIKVIWRGGL